ncbi:hypothetical protein CCP3SC1AL1_810003 [Gammaproteobacteria bacterium]
MMASRGMGAVLPSKMPKGSRKARRDDTDFTQYAEGGEVEEASDVKLGVQRPRLNLKQKELSGRLTAEKQLGANTSLQGYLDGSLNKGGPNVKGFGVNLTHRFDEGGEVWDKPRPDDLGKPKKLSSAKKSKAKAMAKAAGRPYPNLVDNMRAAKK